MSSVRLMDRGRLAVAVRLREDGVRTVLFFHPLYLADDDVERLIPGDPDVAALASILWVPGAIRIPVNPLKGVQHPVWRINTVFIGETEGRDKRLHGRGDRFAPRFHFPRLELLLSVLSIIMERIDPYESAVLHVAFYGVAVHSHPDKAKSLYDGLFLRFFRGLVRHTPLLCASSPIRRPAL